MKKTEKKLQRLINYISNSYLYFLNPSELYIINLYNNKEVHKKYTINDAQYKQLKQLNY